MSGYVLGAKSRAKLAGVHPALVRVVERAIQLTAQDFAVTSGVRTLEHQRGLVERGLSRDLTSNHLVQPDGYGHAADLVPWIGGKPTWTGLDGKPSGDDRVPFYAIAVAVCEACREFDVAVRWGGAWVDARTLTNPVGAVDLYVARRKAQGRTPFVDMPHWELVA